MMAVSTHELVREGVVEAKRTPIQHATTFPKISRRLYFEEDGNAFPPHIEVGSPRRTLVDALQSCDEYQEASLNMPAVAFPHDSGQLVHYGAEPEDMAVITG
jgi:hypothetical protein